MTDRAGGYPEVVVSNQDRCDFAQLVKTYAQPQENERRYSPAECTGAPKVVISGNPDESRICTSHVERQNLTMRMQIRGLTRLTNGFSKKLENHRAAVALHFGFYISARSMDRYASRLRWKQG